jgi:hypothetical protein
MQTFLPYPHFAESAKVLDYRRLGKQRVEVLQLLSALSNGPDKWVTTHYGAPVKRATPWYNHPAAKMWRGYEDALVYYGAVMCREWLNRGYKDTCLDKIQSFATKSVITEPPWLGDSDFHAAHRSNLLRKDPVHYGQFGWTEPNDLPYIWPTI